MILKNSSGLVIMSDTNGDKLIDKLDDKFKFRIMVPKS